MKKISVINQKGGCGKTTLAALIVKSLVNDGKNVLAIDCDPQGGLTALLHGEPTGKTLFDLIMGDTVEPLQKDGFSLLQGCHRLDSIYATVQPFIFEDALKTFSFDVVVIDCPPTLSGITRAAALYSDRVIIPADISRPTMRATLYSVKELKKLKKKSDVYLIGRDPDDKTGFIPDMTREFIEKLDGAFKGYIPKSVTIQKIVTGQVKKPKFDAIKGML
jgi:cellulose biosynthesis protein BcsQ